MRSSTKFKIVTIILCFALLIVTSCENMFTTSIFKSAARDPETTVKKSSTEELVNSGSNPEVVNNPEIAQAALEELAGRELGKITAEDANNILDLTTSAILPISSIADALEQIQNQNNSEEKVELFDKLVESIPQVNTAAVEKILSDPELVNNADISSVVMGTISVMSSTIANTEITQTPTEILSEIVNNVKNDISDDMSTEEKISTVLQGTDFENNSAMVAVVNSILIIKDREDVKNLNLFGIDIGGMFSDKENAEQA